MRKYKAIVISSAIAMAVLVPLSAEAATVVPGGDIINQTWTLAGSPYLVQGDITVPVGSTLTIQAGVDVQFAATDVPGGGIDTTKIEATIRGALDVQGTAANPVTFRTLSGTWFGVVVDTAGATLSTSNLTLQNALNGLRISAGTVSLADFVAHTNTVGLSVTGTGVVNVSNAVFRNNTNHGVSIANTSGAANHTFTGTIFRNNGADGININASGGAVVDVMLTSITAHQNAQNGVYVNASAGSSANATVKNGILTNNVNGINRNTAGGMTTTGVVNTISWGNTTADFPNITAATEAQTINPLYVSAPTNLRISSNSPARFAGDMGQDIGALPYAGDATVGLLGYLWADRTLTLAGSPYTATGDLTVKPGATLTIDPGVTIQFTPTDAMVDGQTPKCALYVEGILKSKGTPMQPVTLTSTTAGTEQWTGLLMESGSGSTTTGIVVTRAFFGVAVDGGNHVLDGFTSFGNRYGFFYNPTNGSSAVVTNAVLRNNTYEGILLRYLYPLPSTVGIHNVTVHQNGGAGIFVEGNASLTVTLTNAIVTNNTSYGIGHYVPAQSTLNVNYVNSWNNSAGNFYNQAPGMGSLSVNPLYVGASSNLRLQSTSPCIDAGSATNAPLFDADGHPRPLDGDLLNGPAFDMGAYEYAPPAVCGDGHLELGEVCDDGLLNGQYGKCAANCLGPGPSCGDGQVNGPEQCDDGNMNNDDACVANCQNASCGDGFVQAGTEMCDDGNMNNDDACVANCQNASCGDGFVQAGVEMCDDSNMNNDDACVANCQNASCGDGFVQAGTEMCDDGNMNNDDACVANCQNASCGDGFVQVGTEMCDDANTTNGDGCSAACLLEGMSSSSSGTGGAAGAGGSAGMGGMAGMAGMGGMAGVAGAGGMGGMGGVGGDSGGNGGMAGKGGMGGMGASGGRGGNGGETAAGGSGGGNPNDGESCSCRTVGEPSNGFSGMMWAFGGLVVGYARRKRSDKHTRTRA